MNEIRKVLVRICNEANESIDHDYFNVNISSTDTYYITNAGSSDYGEGNDVCLHYTGNTFVFQVTGYETYAKTEKEARDLLVWWAEEIIYRL